ncbi:tripartite tricarboxylate transporter TctB family protein [Mesorhizobium sp. BE184]|uniref:tripartite tricarboxylate transporter TctB family protein n=1 Tax=Mesorhizobium sp. BE184 TaxID=2817714 RepID=UPI002855EFEF|nr:tripartite tricarboxylate transporter TctB family protein [Mesorhizobium sp. BE184]MDR7033614.1 F0F1-type ATP synthase membrane subunit c/vacuolar-type H+-ATPase subunit K [Mesorhizobium sp. BE184]
MTGKHFSADMKSGLFFLVVGAFAVWRGLDYDMGTASRMGPGYFPVVLGGILALLGVVIFGRSLVGSDDAEPQEKFEAKSLFLITLAVVGFAVALMKFGLAVAVLLLVFVASAASDSFSLKRVAVLTVVLLAMCVAIFIYGLNLFIPLWPDLPSWI